MPPSLIRALGSAALMALAATAKSCSNSAPVPDQKVSPLTSFSTA